MHTPNPLLALAVSVVATILPAQKPEPAESFQIEIEHTRLPPSNQGRTGTCWSFSTTSFVESELERLHGTPIDLSRVIKIDKPSTRISYDLDEYSDPSLGSLIKDKIPG